MRQLKITDYAAYVGKWLPISVTALFTGIIWQAMLLGKGNILLRFNAMGEGWAEFFLFPVVLVISLYSMRRKRQ